MEWIDVTQDRDRWRGLVNTVRSLHKMGMSVFIRGHSQVSKSYPFSSTANIHVYKHVNNNKKKNAECPGMRLQNQTWPACMT